MKAKETPFQRMMRLSQWHVWFAWYPVLTFNKGWVWLERSLVFVPRVR